jgi:hypothetical protein
MGTQVQRAIETLFPQEGGRVSNVKFHRGWGREVTAEQCAEQLMSAHQQIIDGTAVRITDIDGDLGL